MPATIRSRCFGTCLTLLGLSPVEVVTVSFSIVSRCLCLLVCTFFRLEADKTSAGEWLLSLVKVGRLLQQICKAQSGPEDKEVERLSLPLFAFGWELRGQ